MTILNITEPGHRYFPGKVAIRVSPAAYFGSWIDMHGTGTGEHAEENQVVGSAFFGGVAAGIAANCSGLFL